MRFLILAALALSGAGPGTQTISGTIAVNTGKSVTVVSSGRKLTCAVASAKSRASSRKWRKGARVTMACTREHGRLVLARLNSTPTRPAPPATRRQAVGVITALTIDGVGIQPDGRAAAFTCAITGEPGSQEAASRLKLGGRAGIACRLDGTRWVLSGATPIT